MAELILTISIPDGKVQRSKERFLAVRPNIQVVEGTEDLKYTDKQWFEEKLKQFLRKLDTKGEKKLAKQAVIDNTDMFEV